MAYKDMKLEKDSVKLAQNQWDRYIRIRDHGHLAYVKTAKKNDKFYLGEQWDEADKAQLEDEGRPAITINLAMPLINTILGEFMLRQPMIDVKAVLPGYEENANILSKLIWVILNEQSYQHKEPQLITDAFIQDRGFLDVRLVFVTRQPSIHISVEDPLDILIDRDAKEYDPDTWQEVIKTKWTNLDYIRRTHGDKAADQLQNLVNNDDHLGYDSIELYNNAFGDDSTKHSPQISNDPEEHREIKRLRLLDRQFRTNRKRYYFVDPESGDEKLCPDDWDVERCNDIAEKTGQVVMPRVESVIRWRVTCDKVVLHDEWSPYKRFTIIPYFPYFRRGKSVGLMTNLISPQELVNKIHSQELHVVNTTANSGYLVPANSLVNMTVDELEERGAETGIVIEYNAAVGEPRKIEPNKVPTGLERIGIKAAGFIRDISGVQPAVDGSDHPDVSGKAAMVKSARALVQIEVPKNNLQFTRELMVRHIMDLVQEFYTEQRTFLMAKPAQTITPENPEEYERFTINMQSALGTNVTSGKYQIKIGTRPHGDNFNEMQYNEALAMRAQGVTIPDDAVVMYSGLADKEQLADRIRSANGQNPPSEQEQQAMQLVQQLKIKNIQLQLMRLEAETAEITSKARLNDASAYAKLAELEQKSEEMINKLQMEFMKHQETLDNQMDIATMNNMTKLDGFSSQQRIAQLNRNSQQQRPH